MDAARYRRIADLFAEACDLEIAEQDALLARVDAEDPELAAQVRGMLTADRETTRILLTDPDRGAGAMLAADIAHEAPPERVGPYRIVGRIGAGGMGVVYEAEQEHPRRRVALKTVHPWLQTDAVLALFRFEAQALGDLLHPGIPQVYAAGEADGVGYLAMELVRGLPLGSAAARLDLNGRIALLAELCEAVQHAHDAGILHRDLKPANVLVTAEGQPKVLDFGIATTLLDARADEARGAVGTVAYCSPEQLERGATDASTDLYALGALSYELLTGVLPHAVDGLSPTEAAELKRRPSVPASARNPAIPSDLAWLLERCLDPDPAARPRSARTLATDLRRVLDLQPLEGRGGAGYRLGLWMRRRRRWLGAAAVIGTLGGVATGSVALVDQWREAERQQAADRHLAATDQAIDALVADDAWEEAEALFAAFADLPEHQETPALSDAWRRQALRRRAAGRSGVLPALSEAWINGVDERTTAEAGAELARELLAEGRYGSSWEVGSAVPETSRPREAWFAAAVARRDLDAAVRIGGDTPGTRVLRALSRGRPTGLDSVGVRVLDIDGDGAVELVTIEEDDRVSVRSIETMEAFGTIDYPPGRRVHGYQLDAGEGSLWLATSARADAPGTAFWHADVEQGVPSPWTHTADLGQGEPMDLTIADLGDGPMAWVALAYPERGLQAVDLRTGEVSTPHPPTDAVRSDVMGIESGDLDGDGVPELVLAVSNWTAYDARVLERTPEGLSLRSRRQIGSCSGVTLIPRPDDTPLIGFMKVDDYRNPRVFGIETPNGPPAGLYVLEEDAAASVLDHRHFVDKPLPAVENAGARASKPRVGDLDGDGRADLVVVYVGFRGVDSTDLVIIPDVASPDSEPLLMAGLNAHELSDLDGDGDDELWVSDSDGSLWVLGTGEASIPVWQDPRSLPGEDLGPPPASDDSTVRVWSRAAELLRIGLPEEAAGALSTLARLHDSADVRRAGHASAARLHELSGDLRDASLSWAAVIDELGDESGGPQASEARRGAVRTLSRRLRLEDAWRAAAVGASAAPAWLEPAATASAVPLLPLGPLDVRWDPVHPEALLRVPDGWMIDAFNDQGVLATTPLELTGGRLGIRIDLDVQIAELGAGLAVEVVDPSGEVVLHVSTTADGGGGQTTLRAHCLDARIEEMSATEMASEPTTHRVSLATDWVDGLGLRGCRDAETERVQATGMDQPVPTGPHILRIRAAGDPTYNPPTRYRARIRKLVVRGAEWPAATQRVAQERVTHESRRALASGTADDALAGLGEHPDVRVWAALRSARFDLARADLSTLWARGDDATLRRVLRQEGSPALLRDVVGPEAFADLASASFEQPFKHYAWRPDVQRAAMWPELDAIQPTTPMRFQMLRSRAEVLLREGDSARARRVARSLLASPLDPTDPGIADVFADVHLLLARIDQHLDPANARRHIDAALALAPTEEVGLDVVRRIPELVPLLEGLPTRR